MPPPSRANSHRLTLWPGQLPSRMCHSWTAVSIGSVLMRVLTYPPASAIVCLLVHAKACLQACFLTSLLASVGHVDRHLYVWRSLTYQTALAEYLQSTGRCLTTVWTYLVRAQCRIQLCLRDLQNLFWCVRSMGQCFKALRTSWRSVRKGGGREKSIKKKEGKKEKGTLTYTGTDSHTEIYRVTLMVGNTFHCCFIQILCPFCIPYKKLYAKYPRDQCNRCNCAKHLQAIFGSSDQEHVVPCLPAASKFMALLRMTESPKGPARHVLIYPLIIEHC